MTSPERDILSVLEDAIGQAADVLPDYLTSDELLEFTGLDRHLTKRELGRLMSGAGLRSRGKRIDRTVTKVYAGADILAAIRDRGVPAPATASTPDSGDDVGSIAPADALSALRDRLSGKAAPDPDPAPPRRTVAVRVARPVPAPAPAPELAEAVASGPSEGCGLPFIKNANFALSSAVQVGDPIDARDLDKAQTYIDQLRERGPAQDDEPGQAVALAEAAEASLTQDAATIRAVSADPVPGGIRLIVLEVPLGTPTDEIKRVAAALGLR